MMTSDAKIKSQPGLKLGSVSLVIPAYNDEGTVGKLIVDGDRLLQQVCSDYEIVVVNDGSKDRTLETINDLAKTNPRIRVINHPVNKGYGETIKELYLAGQKEFVFSLPGDYQYAPKELLSMAEGLKNHDLVIGLRVHRNDPVRRKLQSQFYNAMLRVFYGNRHKDVNSIKLFRRAILNAMELQSKTAFVDAELVIRAEKNGFKIIEIPIEHLPRTTQGASGGKISVILETFKDLIGMRSSF